MPNSFATATASSYESCTAHDTPLATTPVDVYAAKDTPSMDPRGPCAGSAALFNLLSLECKYRIFIITTLLSLVVVTIGLQPSFDELCENIDKRLPCSIRKIKTDFTEGENLGLEIGAATGEDIRAFYISTDSCPIYTELYKSNNNFKLFIKDYMAVHEATFSTEHLELVAMARAAKIPPEIAFIQNGCAEFGLLFGDNFNSSAPEILNPPPIHAPYFKMRTEGQEAESLSFAASAIKSGHCSDLGFLSASYTGAGHQDEFFAIQGHNEDWWSSVADKMLLLTTQDWLGYLYPGQLAGTSLVVNRFGLSLTMNSLYPKKPGFTSESLPSKHGVAYLFSYVLRAVMNSTTTAEVESFLSRFPIYSGYSLNVLSACENSITNMEGYGNRLGISTIKGKEEIGSVQGHYNAYVSLAVDQDRISSSNERARCQEKNKFTSPSDIRNFLGDLSCPMFFTNINAARQSETLSTWVMNPHSKTCTKYRLPAACDVSKSRCADLPGFSEPEVFDWEFSCPS